MVRAASLSLSLCVCVCRDDPPKSSRETNDSSFQSNKRFKSVLRLGFRVSSFLNLGFVNPKIVKWGQKGKRLDNCLLYVCARFCFDVVVERRRRHGRRRSDDDALSRKEEGDQGGGGQRKKRVWRTSFVSSRKR